MAVKTISKTLKDFTTTTEQEIRDTLQQTIENGDPLPAYLSIHLIDADQSAEYLQFFSSRATEKKGRPRPTAHFQFDSTVDNIPTHLHDRITDLEDAYTVWHNRTTIMQNFSDDSLTFHLDVTFDENGQPDTLELRISFDIWGIPESGMPTFNEAITYGETYPTPTTEC